MSFESLFEEIQCSEQRRMFNIVRAPRERKCHSCGKVIPKGTLCASYSRGTQTSLNICPECVEKLSSSLKKGEETFELEVGDIVANIEQVEKKQGVVIPDTPGKVREKLSGGAYLVDFDYYYDPVISRAYGPTRVELTLARRAKLVRTKFTARVPGRNLRSEKEDPEDFWALIKRELKPFIRFTYMPGLGPEFIEEE